LTAPRRFSVCQPVFRGASFDEDIDIAVEAGLDAVAVFAIRLGDVDPAKAAVRLRDNGLTVSNYSYFPRVVEAAGDRAVADEGRAMVEDAATVGAETLVVVSGPLGGRTLADGDARCRAWFAETAPFAAECGVRLVLEPLHPVKRGMSFVHTLAHAADITRGVDNASVLADTGHLWWDRNLVEDFRTELDAVALVQFTNADTVEDSTLLRGGLERGDVPIPALLQAFDAAGFEGWYEFEGIADVAPDQRVEYIRRARRWFDALWEQFGP
jgi:sugar phosphate isomerase/epimerase